MSQERHDYFLDTLIDKMHLIDENLEEISWIMKNGIYLRDCSKKRKKLCDLIMGYQQHGVVCVELKGSRSKRSYAIEQLKSSREFVEDELGLIVVRSKFVVYNGLGGYEWELVG